MSGATSLAHCSVGAVYRPAVCLRVRDPPRIADRIDVCPMSHSGKTALFPGKSRKSLTVFVCSLRIGASGSDRFGASGRVDLGGYPPKSPTDPGLHITRTRFLIS